MVQKLNNHFVPRKNNRHARFRLRQNQQKSHQTIMQFYLECRELVRDCQYRNMEDELLLDHLIFEIKNDRLREKAIEEEWNLQKFLEVASRQLASSRQADEIGGNINIKKEHEDDERIRKIKHKNQKKRMQDVQESVCDRCGMKHQPGYCKALGQICLHCGKKGHYKQMCKSGSKSNQSYRQNRSSRRVKKETSEESSASDDEDDYPTRLGKL